MSPLGSTIVESLVEHFLAGEERASASQLVAGGRQRVKEERLQFQGDSCKKTAGRGQLQLGEDICSWKRTAAAGRGQLQLVKQLRAQPQLKMEERGCSLTRDEAHGAHHDLNKAALSERVLADLIHLRS